MKVPSLNEVQAIETVASINISDLIAAGLTLNENFEIPEDFHYVQEVDSDELFYLHIRRSGGWFGNLEFHYAFFLEPSDGGENIHISQEVQIFKDTEEQLCFECPILDESQSCTKLYLRSDFPLFGSSEALKVK
jgi:hypothetical protein